MEYIIIGICITVVIVSAGIFFRSKLISTGRPVDSKPVTLKEEPSPSAPQEEIVQDLAIQVETLPVENISAERDLIEITDSKILARVNNLVPGLLQTGNAANNAVKAAQTQGEVLYRAIIPAGAKLTGSRGMEGAVRGFYHDTKGIQGQANLVAVEVQKGSAVIANTAAAAMGVASMVVGQYYMTQINAELEKISDGISKITDFQNNEYRSRVFSLVSHIKNIAEFQVDILENDELRFSKIVQLNSLEEECTKLLGQADLTLAGYSKKTDLTFDTYEKELQEAQSWFICQNTLLEVLHKISNLRFTLHLGAVSREQCSALLPVYTRQVKEAQTCLTHWHRETTKRLSIDTTEARRKRPGLDKVIHFIPGLINDEWNFRSISERTAGMIDSQTDGLIKLFHDTSDFYAEDVQLISKDGKLYYLPPHKNEY